MFSTTELPARYPSVIVARRGWRVFVLGWQSLQRWHERARERRQLAGLSDAALKDIGVSRVEALREAAKPFWRD